MEFGSRPFPVGVPFPVNPEDPAQREVIDQYLYDELYEFVTNPALAINYPDREEIVDHFATHKQLKKDTLFRGLAARVCQDFRLNPDQIQKILDHWFRSTPEVPVPICHGSH